MTSALPATHTLQLAPRATHASERNVLLLFIRALPGQPRETGGCCSPSVDVAATRLGWLSWETGNLCRGDEYEFALSKAPQLKCDPEQKGRSNESGRLFS